MLGMPDMLGGSQEAAPGKDQQAQYKPLQSRAREREQAEAQKKKLKPGGEQDESSSTTSSTPASRRMGLLGGAL